MFTRVFTVCHSFGLTRKRSAKACFDEVKWKARPILEPFHVASMWMESRLSLSFSTYFYCPYLSLSLFLLSLTIYHTLLFPVLSLSTSFVHLSLYLFCPSLSLSLSLYYYYYFYFIIHFHLSLYLPTSLLVFFFLFVTQSISLILCHFFLFCSFSFLLFSHILSHFVHVVAFYFSFFQSFSIFLTVYD